MLRLPMASLFTLLNRRFLIVDNGFKNSSLLISLESLALIPPFATLPFVALCISEESGLTRLLIARVPFWGFSVKDLTLHLTPYGVVHWP